MEPCLVDPAKLGNSEREAHGIKQQFAKDLDEALNSLKTSSVLRSTLGDGVVDTYFKIKKAENAMLKEMPADGRRNWLIERY